MWIFGHRDAARHRQYRDASRLVVLQAEDGDGIGVRHLPQAEDRQQRGGAGVELAAHRAVADHRRHRPGEAADQRAVLRTTLEPQAVQADVDEVAEAGQRGGQRVGPPPQQAEAGDPEDQAVGQGSLQRDLPGHGDSPAGPLHVPVDVAVDAVVQHAPTGDHQRQADDRGQQQHRLDAAAGGEEVSPATAIRLPKMIPGLATRR